MHSKIATVSLNLEHFEGAGTAFVFQPETGLETIAGKMFALIEVEGSKKNAKKIVDFLINHLEHNYYRNEKIYWRDKIGALKPEGIFEAALVATGNDLSDFLVIEKIKIDPKKISATIGLFYDDQLYFSNTGKNQALLLYKNEHNNNYSLINVEKTHEKKKEEYHPRKVFSSIVSGQMPEDSFFLFANEALAEYLFNREIVEIITKISPLSAAEQIKGILKKINSFAPFMGIIAKNDAEPTEIEQLITLDDEDEEENDEEIPGIQPVEIAEIEPEQELEFDSEPEPIEIAEPRAPINKKKLAKIIGIFIVLCLLAISISIIIAKIKGNTKTNQNTITADVEMITQKLNQIDSFLLYQDETSAKNLYEELKTIFAGLDDKAKSKINNFVELETRMQTLRVKIDKITELKDTDLKTIIELSDNPNQLIFNKSFYYPANGKLYKVTGDKSEEIANDLPENISIGFYDNTNKIYFLGNNQISLYDLSAKKNELIKLNNSVLTSPLGLSVYNEKLYIFNQTNKQLYRFIKDADGYSKPEARLKSVDETATLSDFKIDLIGAQSDVYFARADGQILKFYDGAQINFTLDKVDPVIASNPKIIILKNIYILDQQNNRIIVYQKDGVLVGQYLNANLNNSLDIAVDESSGTIYFLKDKKIISFKL